MTDEQCFTEVRYYKEIPMVPNIVEFLRNELTRIGGTPQGDTEDALRDELAAFMQANAMCEPVGTQIPAGCIAR